MSIEVHVNSGILIAVYPSASLLRSVTVSVARYYPSCNNRAASLAK